MEFLYVCLFSNGYIKVGRSIRPKSRISSHADRVSCFGVALVEHYIVECVGHTATAEAALIGRCADGATNRHKSEWFDGLAFPDVCQWATQEACVEYAAPKNMVGREYWTGKEFDTAIPPAYVFRDLLLEFGHAGVQELSRVSGVPFTTLWKIRSGETANPGIETVRLFASHLDAPQPQASEAVPHD